MRLSFTAQPSPATPRVYRPSQPAPIFQPQPSLPRGVLKQSSATDPPSPLLVGSDLLLIGGLGGVMELLFKGIPMEGSHFVPLM
jgi:hypothetical protein